MRIALKILQFIFTVTGGLFWLFVAVCMFGSIRLIQPSSATFTDGKVLEFAVPSDWCALSNRLPNVTRPASEVVFKKKDCGIKDITKPVKITDLVRLQAKTMAEAESDLKVWKICSGPNEYGITGQEIDGAVYCESNIKNGYKAVTSFKIIDKDYMAITTLVAPGGEGYDTQKKNLIELVNSYGIKK